jgi:hypothetical protein
MSKNVWITSFKNNYVQLLENLTRRKLYPDRFLGMSRIKVFPTSSVYHADVETGALAGLFVDEQPRMTGGKIIGTLTVL